MKFTEMLAQAGRLNDSLLCVGLDPEPAKFPGEWRGDVDRIGDFCARIIDATKDLVVAFKPQIAYFAAHRAEATARSTDRAHQARGARGADHPRRQTRRHRLDGRAVRARGVRALPGRRGDVVALHGLRFDRALPALPGQGRVPAVPYLEPRQRRAARTDALRRRLRLRARRSPGARTLEPSMASSALSSARRTPPKSNACARSRRRCRCSFRASARKAAMRERRSGQAGAPTRRSSSIRRARCSTHRRATTTRAPRARLRCRRTCAAQRGTLTASIAAWRHRLSKIATRTGDDGTTGLGDGTRVPKDHLRVGAMGDVDELNSHIGVLLAEPLPDDVRELLV